MTPGERVLRRALLAHAATVRPDEQRALAAIRSRTAARASSRAAATTALSRKDTAVTILHRPANRLRPADLIVRHPDHPNTPVEYLIARVTKTANGIEVEYTAPPTGRAKRRAEGLLVLALTQDVAIDARPLGGVA